MGNDKLIRDVDGTLVPQHKDATGWVETGDAYPLPVRPLVAKEAWEGNADETKTFESSRRGFNIVNDGDADLTFTINGTTRRVKASESYSGAFDPFTEVSIVTTVPYRAEVLA